MTQIGIGDDGFLRIVPDPGQRLIEVKEAMGATWDEEYGAWKAPALRFNLLQAMEMAPDATVTPAARRLTIGYGFKQGKLHFWHPSIPKLYPYQRTAVGYLVDNPHGSLMCLSPGLGKTAVAIVAAQELRAGRVLIVAPASLLLTWQREVLKWGVHSNVSVAHGSPPAERGWVVTTYEMVVRHFDWFSGAMWDLLILDESVLVKNRTTQRFKAMDALRKRVGKVWMLSGSPTTRYADDLWTQMHLAYPAAFRSYWRFAERYCVFADNIWSKTGREIVGTRAALDPAVELADLMLVMNQEDVLPELPEYLFEVVDLELLKKQKESYRTMLTAFLMDLQDGTTLEASTKLSQLVRLQQITSGLGNFAEVGVKDASWVASAKNNAVIELLVNGTYQTPAIVWTQFKGNAGALTASLRAHEINAKWISGDSSTATRDAMFEEYKAGLYDVLVLSLGVGKFGHTLTNTRTVFYLDKTWNADDYFQSLRRVRRIGLTHRPVIVSLHCSGTVDDMVELNLAGKMPSIAKVTNSQLRELLRGLGV